MGSLNINSYNRRDSFGLGWADQWDYKFNDEKLAAANSTKSSSKLWGKENKKSCLSDSKKPSLQKTHHHNLLNKKKVMDLNKKVLSVANSSAVVAKSAANTGAHKVKTGTCMGMKWLKKQCSLKALK